MTKPDLVPMLLDVSIDPCDGSVHPSLQYVLIRGFTAMGWEQPKAASEDMAMEILKMVRPSNLAAGGTVKPSKQSVVGENPISQGMLRTQEIMCAETMKAKIAILAQRFWSIHPSEIAAKNLTREQFYAREMEKLLIQPGPSEATPSTAGSVRSTSAHEEVMRLMREDFDPRPNMELLAGQWDDNAEDVAEKIIATVLSTSPIHVSDAWRILKKWLADYADEEAHFSRYADYVILDGIMTAKERRSLTAALKPEAAPAGSVREALERAAQLFEEIRIVLIHQLDEPGRSAFWKAVAGRNQAKAALSAPVEAVAVKALEWKREPVFSYFDTSWSAGSISGTYLAYGDETAAEWFLEGMDGRRYAASLTEAKSAAQADYEQRIRSALIATPRPLPSVEVDPAEIWELYLADLEGGAASPQGAIAFAVHHILGGSAR